MPQSATATATFTYPSLPSPTLTNPDMILPYGDYDSTPSPPRSGLGTSSPGGWKGPKPAEMDFSIGLPRTLAIGLGPVTPTTPIIYGNGTMLSDIGEVTEAESTPGRSTRQSHTRPSKGYDSPLTSSPTIGYNALMKRSKIGSHKRTVSKESSSTITSVSCAAEIVDIYDDIDDGISVDDSNFQGDDEESVADGSYEHNVEVAQVMTVHSRKDSKVVHGGDDSKSSAALSRRAEMILATAKKRLDNMEGNLTRARSSLYITPSSSMSPTNGSSPLSGSTPQNERRIVPQLGMPPSKHRQLNNAAMDSRGSPGHARVSSENSLPINPPTHQYTIRSPGAVGDDAETSIKETSPEHDVSDRDIVGTAPLSSVGRSRGSFGPPLEPLSEDDTASVDSNRYLGVRPSTTEPYMTEPGIDHRELTRANSAMQIRDLSEKMKDLRGKISTLRDRAREDTMKRRSLQSLRTPSPFTAAEHWYTSAKEYKGSGLRSASSAVHSPWNGEVSETGSVVEDDAKRDRDALPNDGDMPIPVGVLTQRAVSPVKASVLPQAREAHIPISDHEDQYLTAEENTEDRGHDENDGNDKDEEERELGAEEYEEEFLDHDGLDEYESEGDGPIFYDSFTTPVSHEDREDAFDYEHFFLHSAMGTISQQRHSRRHSTGSFSSEDSVDTTRGPSISALGDGQTGQGRLKEQASRDSISSGVTFETASENAHSDEDDDDDTFAVQSVSAIPDSRSSTQASMKRSTFGSVPSGRVTESQNSNLHRPSVSSFASTSTSRSFPLVNKPKALSSAAASILSGERGAESPIATLAREDQILVERLVASLGKCVLGLHESKGSSYEGRVFKRRLDAARRVLEGQEGAV